MSRMLIVAARQLGDPMLLLVLMEADDLPVHRSGSLDSVCGEPPPGQDETALNDKDGGEGQQYVPERRSMAVTCRGRPAARGILPTAAAGSRPARAASA